MGRCKIGSKIGWGDPIFHPILDPILLLKPSNRAFFYGGTFEGKVINGHGHPGSGPLSNPNPRAMTVADDTGLPMVIINVWLPHGALPVYEEPGGGEEPPVDPNSGRKPLETLMLQVPKRLRMSQPFRSIKKLGIMIEETKARIEKKAAEAEGNGGKESASTEVRGRSRCTTAQVTNFTARFNHSQPV